MKNQSQNYAVIKTGGKQYFVTVGEELAIEKIADTDKKIVFDKVLLVKQDEKVIIGTPYVEKAVIEAEITKSIRAKKIRIGKFKSKARYRKEAGHRQQLTQVKIIKIAVEGEKSGSRKKVAAN